MGARLSVSGITGGKQFRPALEARRGPFGCHSKPFQSGPPDEQRVFPIVRHQALIPQLIQQVETTSRRAPIICASSS
ncbi:MAG: hypothetical protein UZ03_NOB001000542 [Nitrospira sp. OLB3]|nr:MAG: hypothetical protein UZ03_NOB001000542 [Nitrospira sp. OLB3]